MFILIIKYLALGYFIIAALLYLIVINSTNKNFEGNIEDSIQYFCLEIDYDEDHFHEVIPENSKLSYADWLWLFEIIGCLIWPIAIFNFIKITLSN